MKFVSLFSFLILFSFPVAAQEPSTLPTFEAPDDQYIFDALNERNDTLYNALGQAYQNNPTVKAARAELLAVREQISQAQSGFRPTVSVDADITHTDTDVEGGFTFADDGGNTSKAAGVNLSQPLFRGGQTVAQVSQAQNIYAAQQMFVSDVEQGILYDAAVAYMNVVRDKAVMELNENNVELVAREKDQAENRFKVGELTRTDVSQSNARLAAAQAEVINAKGNLKRAKATYQQIIGAALPPRLTYPDTQLDLPSSLQEALNIADSNNRGVLQAKFIKDAAEDNVDSRFGALLPQISAIGNINKSYDPSDFIDEQRTASVGVQASIPLYQAGLNRSQVREAKKIVNQRLIQITEARERARQQTIDSWEALQAAQAEVKARASQIEAARIAREGVQYEAEFGERTTLDALDANQELLDAQVSLITAKRNEVVARFALARTLGLLVPQRLGFTAISP